MVFHFRFESLGQAANLRDCCGSVPYEGGLAAFAAVGDRREIRSIGFNHDSVDRERSRDGPEVHRVLESDDPSEGDVMTEFNNFLSLLQRSVKTMEHAVNVGRIGAENLYGVGPGIALVDDDIF